MVLQKLLGIELPIIQAPMAGVQGSALAVAVSNAGGLGSLPCAMLGLDALRQELTAIKAQTTKPYNVNFFCHAQPELDAKREKFGGKRFRLTSSSTGSRRTPFPRDRAARPSAPQPPTCWRNSSLPS
jgi:NAD(P)H-dependent flavin oxidoreductase YrpB (nitropropane dioxygenase family)